MKKIITALLVLIIVTALFCTVAKNEKFDYVIKNGKIVDGTGNPWYKADIGITADRIADIGLIPEEKGRTIIDATGKVVSPGFIDIHTHTDGIEKDPTAHNYIMQGVTTVISGNCGGGKLQLKEFFEKLEKQRIALNFGSLIGQNAIRSRVMGSADREPTQEEMDEMKRMVEEGMEAGAVGLSNSLKYNPAGIDVKADQYPYTASSTGLGVLFPPWAFEGKGWKEKIKEKELKKKIKEGIVYIIVNERAGDNLNRIRIASYPEDTSIEGKGLKDILEMQGREATPENAAELVLELLLKGRASAIYHTISEEDIERIMKNPVIMHASDGHITAINVGAEHPRSYGTFPRVLALYVREKGIITLEEAIRKMTSLPASRIGLIDTGILNAGKCADIVIFNPLTIKDKATFENSHQYPEGIDYVFVNGEIVVDHGKITGKLPGRIIYGPGKNSSRLSFTTQ